MDFSSLFKVFAWGLLVGGVCVSGLQFGIRILLKTQENSALSRQAKNLRYALAGVLLIGQLCLALWLLLHSGVDSKNALVLGVGLVGGTFFFSLLFQRKD